MPTWEEYLTLDEDIRAEYVDGSLVMSPSPTLGHQRICGRLAVQLDEASPKGFGAVAGWSWHPEPEVEFIPDVMVYADNGDSVRFLGTPVLCVEVLSSNRAADLVLKAGRYAALGVDHYWVIDPDGPRLDVFTRDRTIYRHAETVSSHAVEIDFGIGIGSTVIDLSALVR